MKQFLKFFMISTLCFTLFVSIDGGDKINAEIKCSGGKIILTFQQDGKTVNYETGIDTSKTLGQLKYAALNFIDSQSVINYTYNIDTDGKGI